MVFFYTNENKHYASFELPFTDQYFREIMKKGDWTYIVNLTICIGPDPGNSDRYTFAEFMELYISHDQQEQVRCKIKKGIEDVEAKYGLYNGPKSARNGA